MGKRREKESKRGREAGKQKPAPLPAHHKDVFQGKAADKFFTFKKDSAKYPFLLSYYKYRTITPACIENGIAYSQYKAWFRDDPEFAEACSSIQDKIVNELEDAGFKRALKGSDSLLQFFLRALRSDTYSERKEITGKGGAPLTLGGSIDLSRLPEDTLKKLVDMVEKLENK